MSEADGRGALADLGTRRCGSRRSNAGNPPSLSPASRVFLSLLFALLSLFSLFPLFLYEPRASAWCIVQV